MNKYDAGNVMHEGVVINTTGPGSISQFELYPNLFLKQTRRGCIGNCCGCEQPTEIKIATLENQNVDLFFAQEESSCCLRLFCPSHHPFKMTVSTGAAEGGNKVAEFERPWACVPHHFKCCCYQEILAFDANGASVGTFKETCWYCVPTFNSLRLDGTVDYVVHMPTCCFGVCIDCCAEGCCSCRIPFYIFPEGSNGQKGNEIGKIVKIWGSWSQEITGAHRFEVEFPHGASAESKARLVGATFLLNELWFKHHKNKN